MTSSLQKYDPIQVFGVSDIFAMTEAVVLTCCLYRLRMLEATCVVADVEAVDVNVLLVLDVDEVTAVVLVELVSDEVAAVVLVELVTDDVVGVEVVTVEVAAVDDGEVVEETALDDSMAEDATAWLTLFTVTFGAISQTDPLVCDCVIAEGTGE